MNKRMKILIGYDGSAYADAAIDDLRLAGLPPVGEALVVSVGDVIFTPPLASHELIEKAVASGRVTSAIELAQEHDSQTLGEAQRLVAEAVRRVQEHLPGWEVFPKALKGSPSQELLREAQFWDADVIVVGSRGLSALGRFFLGSVSKTVASEAHCSVRIARSASGKTNSTIGPRIIIGLDGSSGAARAVQAVGMRAWPDGTLIRLIAVEDGVTKFEGVSTGADELVVESNESLPVSARLMAERASVLLLAKGLNVSIEIMEGDPHSVLIDEAREWEADSIFVGSHGLEHLDERSGLGSVSASLVTNAICSVEVVRS